MGLFLCESVAYPQVSHSVVWRDARLSARAGDVRRGPDEFRQGDQRSIAEPVGSKPLSSALLTVDERIETYDPRPELLHDLTAAQQRGPRGGEIFDQRDRHA